jgi:bifunctional non-homologous end joining protein LigD
MADLDEYRAKRRAGRTPEPLEEASGGRHGEPIFVVQRHVARSLHYDLRLERDGVLASWALPRGVPLRGGERALAVHVEDHPLEYAHFEGEIPEGEYGAGAVEIWDRGTYELVAERPDGTLTVRLHGHRLEGEWALVPASLDGKERNWLIVRAAKEHAAGPARRYAPMSPRAARRVPSGPDWAFEIGWEGARAVAPVEGARARFERAGDSAPDERWSRLLARLPRGLHTSECVLDGVVCAFDEDGRPSRALLDGDTGSLVYVVFDLLELDAEPLVDEPWVDRRDRLAALLDDQAGELLLSRAYDDGRELRAAARARGLGIVAKHRQATYRPGTVSDDWRLLAP